MLPTPTTIRWSIRNTLTGALRPRLRAYSASPSKSSASGSGPRACNSGWVVPSGCHSRQPKRRGSLKRNTWGPLRPPCRSTSTWSCAASGVLAGNTRKLPDIPRCSSALPAAVSSSRYLARRRTASMRCPGSSSRTSSGMGQRRSGRRRVSAATRRPTRCGAKPRRVVSTSGNSGIRKLRGTRP